MLHVHIYLDDSEAEMLQKVKGKVTWKELLVLGAEKEEADDDN